MLDTSETLIEALENLRDWRAKYVWEIFDAAWEPGGGWLTIKFDKERASEQDVHEAAWRVMKAFTRAGPVLLEMQGIDLTDREDAHFDFDADIANNVLWYAAFQPEYFPAEIQQSELSFPLDGTEFFQSAGFVSPLHGGDQWIVFDAWRPHGAGLMKLSWGDKESLFTSTDLFAPIWPEYTRGELLKLCQALDGTMSVTPKLHERGFWIKELIADFSRRTIRFTQTEVVKVEHQLLSGIMPLDELVWLAATPAEWLNFEWDDQEFLSTGVIAREITEEELVSKSGVPDHVWCPPADDDADSDTEFDDSGYPESVESYRDEEQLQSEEFSSDQDAYTRSNEDGWFYDD